MLSRNATGFGLYAIGGLTRIRAATLRAASSVQGLMATVDHALPLTKAWNVTIRGEYVAP